MSILLDAVDPVALSFFLSQFCFVCVVFALHCYTSILRFYLSLDAFQSFFFWGGLQTRLINIIQNKKIKKGKTEGRQLRIIFSFSRLSPFTDIFIFFFSFPFWFVCFLTVGTFVISHLVVTFPRVVASFSRKETNK